MKEWRQTITSICTVVLAIAALATIMQFQFAGLRAEMRAEHGVMRMQTRDEHAALRGEHDVMRMQTRDEHAALRGEHSEIRAELANVRDLVIGVDRRTARIEGHLFGIEIAPDPVDGE